MKKILVSNLLQVIKGNISHKNKKDEWIRKDRETQ